MHAFPFIIHLSLMFRELLSCYCYFPWVSFLRWWVDGGGILGHYFPISQSMSISSLLYNFMSFIISLIFVLVIPYEDLALIGSIRVSYEIHVLLNISGYPVCLYLTNLIWRTQFIVKPCCIYPFIEQEFFIYSLDSKPVSI